MDPLMSLIGAGVNAVGGIFGRQQQRWQMEGGFLPGLVANAQRAGINPLAALGVGGKSGSSDISSAIGSAGSQISRIDPFEVQLRQDSLRKSEAETKLIEAQARQQDIQTAIAEYTRKRLEDPSLYPAGIQWPPERTTIPGVISDPKLGGRSPIYPTPRDGRTVSWDEWFDSWRQMMPTFRSPVGGGVISP